MPFSESKESKTEPFLFRAIDNLALSGGGTKGLYYLGVFLELHDAGILQKVKRISGTSIGSLMGLGIVLGYHPQDLTEKILSYQRVDKLLKYRDFIPDDPENYYPVSAKDKFVTQLGKSVFNMAKSVMNALWTGGILHGKYNEYIAKLFIKEKFPDKENLTFGELHELSLKNPELNLKDFYVTAVNMTNKGRLEVFSWESTPDMPIAKAIQCSMAVPGLYKPVIYNEKTYVDGGLLCNFPVGVFDFKRYIEGCRGSEDIMNMRTLGISLSEKNHAAWMRGEVREEESEEKTYLPNLKSVKRVISQIAFYQDRLHRANSDPMRTIYLETDEVSFFDFNLTEKDTLRMIDRAKESVRIYIEKYLKNKPDLDGNASLKRKLESAKTVLKFYSLFMSPQQICDYFKRKRAVSLLKSSGEDHSHLSEESNSVKRKVL